MFVSPKPVWAKEFSAVPPDPRTVHIERLRRMEERWAQRQAGHARKQQRPHKAKIQLIKDPLCVSDQRHGYVMIDEDWRDGTLRVRDLYSVAAVLTKGRQTIFTFDLRQLFPNHVRVGDLNAFSYKFTEFIGHPAVSSFEKRLFLNDQEIAWTRELKKLSFFELRERGLRIVLHKPSHAAHKGEVTETTHMPTSGRVTFDLLRVETPKLPAFVAR
jgi:hypothetical protein